MKTVLLNCPWAEPRLKNIAEWWGLEFVFVSENISVPFVPMQAHPTMQGLAVMDMEFVNKHKNGFTLFVAPYQSKPLDRWGREIPNRASVNGIYLPSTLSFQRWEWWTTRLFWTSPVIEVFANETDQVYVNGVSQGNAFEVWSWHEWGHALARICEIEDTTHKWFYSGQPEKMREEVLKILKPWG